MRVPLGVVAIIFEARPNVTADAAGLCLKSGNAAVLRGGKEAIHSNKAIVAAIREAIVPLGFPAASVSLVESTERESAVALMHQRGLVDVLIPSEEFAKKITGCDRAEDAARVLEERYHPQVLVITQGSEGGFLWESGKAVRYPVFPVKAIDSNGAGDTFHGAFVAARLKGMSVYDACRFASATSALKCTRFGAQAGIPGYEEVLEFMKSHEGVIVNG